ncbi:hypothetical protein [Pseudomonas aeruginosa]
MLEDQAFPFGPIPLPVEQGFLLILAADTDVLARHPIPNAPNPGGETPGALLSLVLPASLVRFLQLRPLFALALNCLFAALLERAGLPFVEGFKHLDMLAEHGRHPLCMSLFGLIHRHQVGGIPKAGFHLLGPDTDILGNSINLTLKVHGLLALMEN